MNPHTAPAATRESKARNALRRLLPYLGFLLIVLAFCAILFSEYLVSGLRIGWLSAIAIEIRAACLDPSMQWMLFLSTVIYFVTFTVLAKRLGIASSSAPRRRSFGPDEPDSWLFALLLVVAATYALGYQSASTSLQPLLLIVGAAVGKGAVVWVLWGAKQTSNLQYSTSSIEHPTPQGGVDSTTVRTMWIPATLVLLLAAAALWKPALFTEFQYRGVRRWSGAWSNPNIYGLLMAVGTVLGVGMLFRRWEIESERTSSRWLSGTTLVLFLGAAGVCGYGLLKSYSRGAWLGAFIGLAFLLWSSLKERTQLRFGDSFNSWFRRNLLLLSVILVSLLVLAFWQFRHTEWAPARRVFSVANANDFSWRNRVTTWQGAFQMMADKPLVGFGWGSAEKAYRSDYPARRLEETAAIQMNDYLMLGISAGVPALVCFLIYLWLSLTHGRTGKRRNSALICHAGALVLLIGFWFDGGLFKLPTAAVFWTLLELGCVSNGSSSHRDGG